MKCVTALVIISFVHILFVHNGQTFKGIKMCQRDCEMTKGCTGIYYDPVHLECRLLFDVKNSAASTPPAVTRQIVKTSATKAALKICSARDHVVTSGMGKPVCVPTEDTSKHSPNGRILFADIFERASISQLTLGRQKPTINIYPFIKPLEVLSLRYSSSLRSLFVLQAGPGKIFSIYIGKRKKSVIRIGQYSGLGIDRENSLLFAVYVSHDIHRMTTQGKLLRHVHHSPRHRPISILDITIDPQHSLLYILWWHDKSRKYTVISMKYSGGVGDVLFEITGANNICFLFHQMSHTLVYTHNNKLMSYDPSAKEQKHSVLTTVDDIRGITAYKGTLYFVDGNSLMEFRNKKEKKILVVGPPGHHWYQLCIID